jgi:hypothetical protein
MHGIYRAVGHILSVPAYSAKQTLGANKCYQCLDLLLLNEVI